MFGTKGKRSEPDMDLNVSEASGKSAGVQEKMLELINASSYVTYVLTAIGFVTFLPVAIISIAVATVQSFLKLRIKSKMSAPTKRNIFKLQYVASRMRLVEQEAYVYAIERLSENDFAIFAAICENDGKSLNKSTEELYTDFQQDMDEQEFVVSIAQLQRFGLVNIVNIFHYGGRGISNWKFAPDPKELTNNAFSPIKITPTVITSNPSPTVFGRRMHALYRVAKELQLDRAVVLTH